MTITIWRCEPSTRALYKEIKGLRRLWIGDTSVCFYFLGWSVVIMREKK